MVIDRDDYGIKHKGGGVTPSFTEKLLLDYLFLHYIELVFTLVFWTNNMF